jgi:hypothetical protein
LNRKIREGSEMRLFFLATAVLLAASATDYAQTVPAAIYTDPPADAAHTAGMVVLHIPSHGTLINGIVYTPAGAGPHPTLVICHGLPGTKRTSTSPRRCGVKAGTQ